MTTTGKGAVGTVHFGARFEVSDAETTSEAGERLVVRVQDV